MSGWEREMDRMLDDFLKEGGDHYGQAGGLPER
jgi:hypothetical protein